MMLTLNHVICHLSLKYSQPACTETHHCQSEMDQFSYTLIPARFPKIEGASGNVSEHHTSRSSWLISRTELGEAHLQAPTSTTVGLHESNCVKVENDAHTKVHLDRSR